MRGDCIVAIDGPLIVTNATGQRPAERALNVDFGRFEAGAHSANTRIFAAGLRGARIADALGLDMNPNSGAPRRAIEVYPHPATISLFRLGRTLKYKKGDAAVRRAELLRLMELIEGLADASPSLRVTGLPGWIELHSKVTAATRPFQLDKAEDPVDAVLCAYIAMYAHHWPDDVTVYGDFDTGYIVTPTLPPGSVTDETDIRARLRRT